MVSDSRPMLLSLFVVSMLIPFAFAKATCGPQVWTWTPEGEIYPPLMLRVCPGRGIAAPRLGSQREVVAKGE